MNTHNHRIAIVTGASRERGIGTAICRALATAGVDIFFTHWGTYDAAMPWGVEKDWPTLLQNELRAMGVRCESMAVDLSTVDAATRIMDEVEARLGNPSILVNNATYSTNDGYKLLSAEILDRHYAVNMRGTMLLSVEFARRFAGTSGGRIISMTSGQAVTPMPEELAYIATKGAIEAFTVSLAADLSARGITVNAVDPGATDTGWMTEELRQQLIEQHPQKRIGQPEDAARLVAFLASDDARWITGQIIHSRG
ncbi:MAG TPA: SDR family oxidoreductase [Ktedonobacteraceae bacterium]|nr:SDR family oxidoreductase [Ktedonobacteraceae bacterium]